MKEPLPKTQTPSKGPPLRRFSWPGVCVIGISIALMRLQPAHMGELPRGMVTPVLALELARTPDEVERIFGPKSAPEREVWRRRFVQGTFVDFALIVSYGIFLSGVASEFVRAERRLGPRLSVGLALVAPLADVVENRQLLSIFAQLGGASDALFGPLMFATWTKWLALAGYFAFLAPSLWRAGGFLRAAAVGGVVGALGAVVALPFRGVAAEVMLNGLAIGMALLVVGAYRSPPHASVSSAAFTS